MPLSGMVIEKLLSLAKQNPKDRTLKVMISIYNSLTNYLL